MTTIQRLAIAAAAVFLGLACWAAFVPPHSHGNSCGTWMAPVFDRGHASADLAQAQDAADDPALALGGQTDLGVRAVAFAQAEVILADECGDSLGSRQSLTWGFLAGALVVPVGVMFVGSSSGRRRLDQAPD